MSGVEYKISRLRRSVRLDLAGRLSQYAVAGVLIVFCVSSLYPLAREIARFFLLAELGYGDSYILYDVLQFQKTGFIYRDLSQPPYLPAQYSPILYILFSVPGRILASQNPFAGPRLLVISAFLACIGIVVSIVRTLIPARFSW